MEQIHNATNGTRPFTKYDADYKALVKHMQATLDARMQHSRAALFRTKTAMKVGDFEKSHGINPTVHLNDVYLAAITEDERQYHTCECCRSFMKRYAGLVTIDAQGKTQSVLWDSTTFPQDNYYFTLVERMQEVVESGAVAGVAHSAMETWGDFSLGGFEHFGVISPVELRFRRLDITPGQRQAQQYEAYVRMAKGFSTDLYSLGNLTKLMRLIEGEVLPGDEIITGAAKWLIETATERAAAPNGRIRDNLLWRAIASASEGWTRKKTMTGTVLEGLLKGESVEVIKAKFVDKTQADKLGRPTAAPKMGTINQAEKLFETMGLTSAARRRVAYLTDFPESAYLWSEKDAVKPEAAEAKGLFDHLKPKSAVDVAKEDLELPPVKMSWNKFFDEVFPKMQNIEYFVQGHHDFFGGFATQAVDDAKPILMYDLEDERNPISAYQRSEHHPANGQLIGTHPSSWNLPTGQYVQVQAIVKGPHHFGKGHFPQLGQQVFFVLEGAYDTTIAKDIQGLALFPNLLRTELHGVRSVIEAFSNKGRFEGDSTKQAAGAGISRASAFYPRRLRVQTGYGPRVIIIDRWE